MSVQRTKPYFKWTAVTIGVALSLSALFYPRVYAADTRVVDVQLTDKGFTPKNVLATLDTPIELRVVNSGHHHHQFSIPYYRIFSRDLAPGEVTDIRFAPWTVGKFSMMSDPSGDDEPEFTGQFIVNKTH